MGSLAVEHKWSHLISKELAAEVMQLHMQDAVKQLGGSQGGRGRRPAFSCPLPAACTYMQSMPRLLKSVLGTHCPLSDALNDALKVKVHRWYDNCYNAACSIAAFIKICTSNHLHARP